MSLCQLLFARGRYKHNYTFYLHYSSFTFSYFFYIETVHSFLHSLLKFYSKHKFVWFCYLVVFISTLLFCKQLPVLPGCVVKNNAVQYRSPRWEKSHEIVIKMLRVKKVGTFSLSERIWGVKAGPNRASIGSSKKRIMLDYQYYQLPVLMVKVVRTTSLKIPNQYRRTREDTRGAPQCVTHSLT